MNTDNQGILKKFINTAFGILAVEDAVDYDAQELNDYRCGHDMGNEFGRDHGYLDGYANALDKTRVEMFLPNCCSPAYVSGNRAGYNEGYDAGFIKGQHDRQQDWQSTSH